LPFFFLFSPSYPAYVKSLLLRPFPTQVSVSSEATRCPPPSPRLLLDSFFFFVEERIRPFLPSHFCPDFDGKEVAYVNCSESETRLPSHKPDRFSLFFRGLSPLLFPPSALRFRDWAVNRAFLPFPPTSFLPFIDGRIFPPTPPGEGGPFLFFSFQADGQASGTKSDALMLFSVERRRALF